MTAMNTSSNLLMKLIVPPSKIANALDWRKMTGSTVLSLDIHADRIGVALAGHPLSSPSSMTQSRRSRRSDAVASAAGGGSIQHIESLPLSTRSGGCGKHSTTMTETRQRLNELVMKHNVCGFVVSWPIQQDTGRMGASCGRTLHTLEQLLGTQSSSLSSSSTSTSSQPVISPSRPFCLWDPRHVSSKQPTVDQFGRSVAYSMRNDGGNGRDGHKVDLPSIHSAKRLQYHQDQSITVEQVWKDFSENFWPQCEQEASEEKTITAKTAAMTTSATKSQQRPQMQQIQHRRSQSRRRSRYQEPECHLDSDGLSSLPSLSFAA